MPQGSVHPCVPGFVAVEPPVFAVLWDVHPVPADVTLLVRQFGTDWLEPGQPVQNWISEQVVDTMGPLVVSRGSAPSTLDVRVATGATAPAPFWTISASGNPLWATISPRAGSNGGLRVAFTEPGRAAVANLSGSTSSVAGVSGPLSPYGDGRIGVDGDDVVYQAPPNPPGHFRIAVDECVF